MKKLKLLFSFAVLLLFACNSADSTNKASDTGSTTDTGLAKKGSQELPSDTSTVNRPITE